MTGLLDRVDAPPAPTSTDTSTPAERLRGTMAACRVRFTWFGVQKSLTAPQKALAAGAFDAEAPCLSAAKRLVDTRHAAFRAVTAVRSKITEAWRSVSLPFPEPGVRLIKQECVAAFAADMADYKAELDDAVAGLGRHYGELKRSAESRLGSLFDPADYPATLDGLFDVAVDFPGVEPPGYLVALCPGLYEREQARVTARFEEAVRLAEDAFLDEFARAVTHLCERVTGVNDDGTPKVFRDSAVGNLLDFFDRFRSLNVRSDARLDELVDRARRAVRGVDAGGLRDSGALRDHVAEQLGRVGESLDAMLVARPRRRILRQASTPGGD